VVALLKLTLALIAGLARSVGGQAEAAIQLGKQLRSARVNLAGSFLSGTGQQDGRQAFFSCRYMDQKKDLRSERNQRSQLLRPQRQLPS
jgi:hypothetical protein